MELIDKECPCFSKNMTDSGIVEYCSALNSTDFECEHCQLSNKAKDTIARTGDIMNDLADYHINKQSYLDLISKLKGKDSEIKRLNEKNEELREKIDQTQNNVADFAVNNTTRDKLFKRL